MNGKLDGGVAIVTGSASGIGRALAEAFGARGMRLFLIDIDAEALETAAHALREAGFDAATCQADLRNLTALQSAAEAAAALGPVRALCLNAGVASTGATLWETSDAAFDLVTGVNLRGLFYSIKAFVPLLLGHDLTSEVVITASMAGLTASPTSGVYSASKAGAIALAKALRGELAPWPRIRVALVNPSLVKTNLIRSSLSIEPNAMNQDVGSATQAAFDSSTLTPQAIAEQVVSALDRGEFWVMPSHGDVFLEACLAEIEEMTNTLGREDRT